MDSTGTTTHADTDPERWRATSAWAGAAALLCGLVWLGYRLVYAQFQSYDDEGYLLITVQQFLQGVPLYDAVYTQYGPAYYLWQQMLHGPGGIPLTHDATRVVTLAIWLVCSALIGLVVWLLTKRSLLTAVAIVLAFFHLTPLTFEPGHPQELCLLSVLLVVVIALWRVLNHRNIGTAAAVSIGALVAVTALTKVNVGAFLVCAMTLAVVTSAGRLGERRGMARAIVLTIMIAILIPLRHDLLRSDVAAFVVVIWSGLFAALLVDRDVPAPEGLLTLRDLMACCAGFSIASIVTVSAIVLQGTSLQALFEGLFVSPLDFPNDLFWTRVPVTPAAAAVALFWLFAAVCLRYDCCSVRRWMPYVKLTMARGVCLLALTNWFNPLLALGPPFASVVLADPHLDARRRVARRILVFSAMLMALQVYPMPGTQVALGTLLLLPVALVLIPEAEQELDRPRSPSRLSLFGLGAPALLLIAVLGVVLVMRTQQSLSSGTALRMPGAEHVHTTEAEAAAYRWLTANLREHCERFITAPGFNSLHLWTGVPPVSSLNTTVWPVLLDDVQQKQIVQAAAPVEQLCIVWSQPAMLHLLSGPDTASGSLVAFIAREFETVASYGEWEFRVRRGREVTLLNQGQWTGDGDLLLDLVSLGNQPLKRIQVLDLDSSIALVDSATEDGVVALDENNHRLEIKQGIDISRQRRLLIRGTAQIVDPDHTVIVRLWGDESQPLATVPVVSATGG